MTSPYTRVMGVNPTTALPGDDVVDALTDVIAAAQSGAIAAAAASGPVSSVAGKTGAVSLVKADVGLGNVDNTTDLNKPVSTLQQAAINGRAPLSHTHPITELQTTGTPTSATALHGDGSWKIPGGGGAASQQLALASKNAAFTVADDGIECYEVTSATDIDVTLPAAVPSGLAKEISWIGAGRPTVVAGAGASLLIPASSGAKVKEQNESIHVRARASSIVTSPPATNLLMRFKADDIAGADGAAVSSWAESSGQGHPAAVQATSTAQPTLRTNAAGSGHKGVAFDGASDFLTLSGTALNVARNRSALCIFAALALTTAVTTGTRTLFGLSSGTSATSARVLLGHRESTGGLPILGGRRLDANSLQSVTAPSALNTAPQSVLLTGRMVFSSSDLYFYQNGTLVGSNTSFQTDGVTSDTASLAGVIGASLAGTGEWFLGTLFELLVYDGDDPTGSLRQSVHSYIAQTYNGFTVSDALPATTQWLVLGGSAT